MSPYKCGILLNGLSISLHVISFNVDSPAVFGCAVHSYAYRSADASKLSHLCLDEEVRKNCFLLSILLFCISVFVEGCFFVISNLKEEGGWQRRSGTVKLNVIVFREKFVNKSCGVSGDSISGRDQRTH